MKLGKGKLEIIKSFCAAKFFGFKKPLFVSWVLTHRCNLRCKYCNLAERQKGELSTAQVIAILDQLGVLGTKVISFIGGEPLIREDIGDIISYAVKKGIIVRMFSNGILIPKNIAYVRLLDQLAISLEGGEGVHDSLRGKGSFKQAAGAIERAVKEKIKVGIATVLTGYNAGSFEHILDIAGHFGISVRFQPLNDFFCTMLEKNLIPSRESYYSSMKKIIRYKRQFPKRIGNSMASLHYLLTWPEPHRNLRCPSGEIFCRIATNGDLSPCTLLEDSFRGLNCIESGVEKAFNNLWLERSIIRKKCHGCWCAGTLELACLYSMLLSSWGNLLS